MDWGLTIKKLKLLTKIIGKYLLDFEIEQDFFNNTQKNTNNLKFFTNSAILKLRTSICQKCMKASYKWGKDGAIFNNHSWAAGITAIVLGKLGCRMLHLRSKNSTPPVKLWDFYPYVPGDICENVHTNTVYNSKP